MLGRPRVDASGARRKGWWATALRTRLWRGLWKPCQEPFQEAFDATGLDNGNVADQSELRDPELIQRFKQILPDFIRVWS